MIDDTQTQAIPTAHSVSRKCTRISNSDVHRPSAHDRLGGRVSVGEREVEAPRPAVGAVQEGPTYRLHI